MMANILIVEDEVNMLRLLQDWLEFDNHTVYLAKNGLEGLDILSTQVTRPDVIISDLAMPEMNGFELLSHIKQDEQWKNTHVIVISGSRADGQVAIEAGADQFLLKPFTLTHLEKALSNL
jgi:CheY-like chemotaxis protein